MGQFNTIPPNPFPPSSEKVGDAVEIEKDITSIKEDITSLKSGLNDLYQAGIIQSATDITSLDAGVYIVEGGWANLPSMFNNYGFGIMVVHKVSGAVRSNTAYTYYAMSSDGTLFEVFAACTIDDSAIVWRQLSNA